MEFEHSANGMIRCSVRLGFSYVDFGVQKPGHDQTENKCGGCRLEHVTDAYAVERDHWVRDEMSDILGTLNINPTIRAVCQRGKREPRMMNKAPTTQIKVRKSWYGVATTDRW